MPSVSKFRRLGTAIVASALALALTAGLAACLPPEETESRAVVTDPDSKYGLPKLVGIEPVIRPETYVLTDDRAVSRMTITNEDRCRAQDAGRVKCEFRLEFTAVPDAVKLGTVLVSGVTEAMPAGALVVVTEIDDTTVLAVEGTLSDAIEDGEFLMEEEFTAQDIVAVETVPSVTIEAAPSVQALGGLGSIGMSAMPSADEANDSIALTVGAEIVPGVTATGSVGLTIGCGVYGGLTWKKYLGVPIYPNGAWYQGQCGANQNGSLTISADASKAVSKTVEVAQLTMASITFTIGPVPVVLVPHITVSIGADGGVKAGMSFGASEGFSALAGIKYSGGISVVKDFKVPFFDQAVSVGSGRSSLEAGLIVAADVLLYGLAGPRVTLKLYAKLEGAPPGQSPIWCMKGGLAAGVGIRLDLGIQNIVWGPEEIFDTSVELGCAPNQAPELLAPSSLTVYPGVAGALGAISLSANDPEEGPVAVTYSSNVSGLLGTANPKSGLRVDSLPFGPHTITATATDSTGLSTTVVFSLTAIDSSPSLAVTARDANGNWVPTPSVAGQRGGTINVQVTVANGIGTYLNSCSTVKWTGPLPVTSVGGCEYVITLSQAGTAQLTATTTDPDGKKGSGTIAVTVSEPQGTPPPLFSEISVSTLDGRGIQDNGQFFDGERIVLVESYQNFSAAQVPVRYAWSYTVTPLGGTAGGAVPLTSGGSDSNSGSSRQFTVPTYFGRSYTYTFTVSISNANTNTVITSRSIRIGYTGAPN